MSSHDKPSELPSEEECRRINAESGGAPPYYFYPATLPISEEARKRYDQVAAKLPPLNSRGRPVRRKKKRL